LAETLPEEFTILCARLLVIWSCS